MSRRHTLRAALVACAVGLLGLVPASAQQVFTSPSLLTTK